MEIDGSELTLMDIWKNELPMTPSLVIAKSTNANTSIVINNVIDASLI